MGWAASDLVAALRRLVLDLEADLRARVDGADEHARQPGVLEAWQRDYDAAFTAQRTAATWQEWRNDRVTQSAVAWVLVTVFARYCEDTALVASHWIGGADGDQRAHALDARRAYFQAHPEHTDREWLGQIIEHFAKFPATAGLVDRFSPLHLVAPSGDAARALLEFWWQQSEDGQPVYSFAGVDTRFLGDVYQDLSEHAKKTYALLQTPEFVEEFILNQTMEPALADRPLDGFTVIDPTCGSGHFLLGAFRRLHEQWQRHAPALGSRELVEKALDSIYGVDINPFAVAIARFRLLVAALHAAGDTSIEQRIAYNPHLAAGDSLLWGANQQLLPEDLLASGPSVRADTTENAGELTAILHREHDVVVGNPPYINVKDPALNKTYRDLYETPYRQYALTVPFMELFFRLAHSAGKERPTGWIGQITSNSFMKREFGKRLIEEFLPKVDVRAVIDSEGAWIPGHNSDGTPTVIMVGRNCRPSSSTIRAVLSFGLRETKETIGAPYWKSIVDEVGNPGFANEWISVAELDRSLFTKHPWSLSGGGAIQLMQKLDAAPIHLNDIAPDIGFVATTRADDAYDLGSETLDRLRVASNLHRAFITGPTIRDWSLKSERMALCPYDCRGQAVIDIPALRFLWRVRPQLEIRQALSGTQIEQGREWWEYSQLHVRRFEADQLIAFAEIASHNHFILTAGKRVFDRTAPVIELVNISPVRVHEVIAALNSSTICFWMKEKCKPKGGSAGLGWARTYQFNVTKMRRLPLPSSFSGLHAESLERLGTRLLELSPAALLSREPISAELFDNAQVEYESTRKLMIAAQEEIDWQAYAAYKIVDADLSFEGDLPEIGLGQRAFEIAIASRTANQSSQSWLDTDQVEPTQEIPDHLPEQYKRLMAERIDCIRSNSEIRLLESPQYKRTWLDEPWPTMVRAALRRWLLCRIDTPDLWFDREGRPTPLSVGQIADHLDRNENFRNALYMWSGDDSVSATALLSALLVDECVPFLAAWRYTESGLEKHMVWSQTWDVRRKQEQGAQLDATTPIPEDFESRDFEKYSYWKNRRKLDLPTERFISYPAAGRDSDSTELLGWAGWDHAEQALALAGLISQRIEDGWGTRKLVPLLAGLNELLPWVRQWHNEIDPDFGESVADTIDDELTARMAEHHLAVTDLTSWRPEATTRGRKTKTS